MPITTQLKDYLERKNVRPRDAGKVLLAFKGCMYLTWIGLIPICGRFQPLRRFFRLQGPRRFRDRFIARYPQTYQHWETSVMRTSEWFGSRSWVKWIPDTFGQKHKDFGLAIAEASVIYKLFLPIWAPLEFMTIVRFYQKRWHVTLPSMEEFQESYQHSSEIGMIFNSQQEQEQQQQTQNNQNNNNQNTDSNNTNNDSNNSNNSANNSNNNRVNAIGTTMSDINDIANKMNVANGSTNANITNNNSIKNNIKNNIDKSINNSDNRRMLSHNSSKTTTKHSNNNIYFDNIGERNLYYYIYYNFVLNPKLALMTSFLPVSLIISQNIFK